MSFWRTFLQTIARNPISFFAVFCVAATATFLGYMTSRMADVLESPKWCSTAIDAERISPGSTYVGLTTCVDLLKIQLQAMATGFHISVGSYALTLLVLIVVVIAGARASAKIGPDGLDFDVSRDATKAAEQVANAAEEEADEIKSGGPAMPEPKP